MRSLLLPSGKTMMAFYKTSDGTAFFLKWPTLEYAICGNTDLVKPSFVVKRVLNVVQYNMSLMPRLQLLSFHSIEART